MSVKDGDKVQIEYEGKLKDGTVFDSSKNHDKPLEFEVGKKMVIPGFEKAVMGMEKDEEKEVTIEPKDAYGDPNPQLIQKVPKDKMPPDIKEGMMVGVALQNGHQVPAKITKIEGDTVTLDLNSPLAGKTLIFKIKVVGIN